jgi:hypothetical protein
MHYLEIEAINHMHAMPWVLWNTPSIWSMHACVWAVWMKLGENGSNIAPVLHKYTEANIWLRLANLFVKYQCLVYLGIAKKPSPTEGW